jgi:hypothetical protein
MNYIESKYNFLCAHPSDINEHLPTLYKYATECETAIELGVRGCVSSWAIVCGLIHNNSYKKKLLMNDIEPCNVQELFEVSRGIVEIEAQWKNDLEVEVSHNYDMVFIDTWHVYGQLKRELDKYSKITNKYIIMHDTEIDGIRGESYRYGWTDIEHYNNTREQSKVTGIPVEEITRGLLPAIDDFLEANQDWMMIAQYKNNNGLTVLKRKAGEAGEPTVPPATPSL